MSTIKTLKRNTESWLSISCRADVQYSAKKIVTQKLGLFVLQNSLGGESVCKIESPSFTECYSINIK